jgi:hypothetical protein
MKRLLLALSCGLLIPACVATSPGPASSVDDLSPSSDGIEDGRSLPTPSEAIQPLAVNASCLALCRTRYDSCIARAQDDTAACLCFNQMQLCITGCGGHGILRVCPTE